MDRIKILLGRLWIACQHLPDLGGDLWSRGLEKIQEKHGVVIYLSEFRPTGMVEEEQPEAEITIKVTGWDKQ